MLDRVSQTLDRLLQGIVIALMVTLTLVVVVAVIYRKAGASLVWYDEVASILLAWLTYYGAALAALKRAHIGFDGLVRALPRRWRLASVVVAEAFVFGFFGVLAWTGWVVLQVLVGDTLVSLTWVPVQLTQSVIPVGALLFMLGEALSLPAHWRQLGQAQVDPFDAPTAAAGEGAR
ncbi:MAG TPA: TRAP transporter small permease subunit [Kiloniellales bacterium]|nr:TRAP transporter small permease subunit [Kiloniellales bacterium]